MAQKPQTIVSKHALIFLRMEFRTEWFN